MTDTMMTLRTLLEKSSDADLLREMIGFTAQRLMALEVENLTGAAPGERSPDRINQYNSTRPCLGNPYGGAVYPCSGKDLTFPAFLNPGAWRRRLSPP